MPERPMIPDPFLDRLARFTPAARGLDRDELLFRAGRASAPSPRWWRLAAGVLAVTQAATLVALALRPHAEPPALPTPPPAPVVAPDGPPPPSGLPPASYGALVRGVRDDGLPPSPPPAGPAADDPPLTAAAARYGQLID